MRSECVVKFKNAGFWPVRTELRGKLPIRACPVEAGLCTTLARHLELLPAGLVPVEAQLQTGAPPIRGQTGVPLGRSPEGTFLSSACGSAETRTHGTRPAEARPLLKGNPQFKTGQTTSASKRLSIVREITVQSMFAIIVRNLMATLER